MEILFFYLGNNDVFRQDLPINFGGQYLFYYDRKKEELLLKDNPYYISDFFQLSKDEKFAHVKNVTGIIGENGTGKSSLLAYLKSALTRGLHGIRFPLIMALMNDQNEKIIYHHIDYKISKGNFLDFGFITRELKIKENKLELENAAKFVLEEYPEIIETESLDIIFFSNIFDGTIEYDFDGSKNISTNFLLRNEVKKNLENRLLLSGGGHQEVEQFLFEDIARQIDFVNKFEEPEIVPFELPDKLIISPKRDFINTKEPLSVFEQTNLDEGLYNFIRELINLATTSIQKEDGWKTRAEYHFIAICLINFLYGIRETFSLGIIKKPVDYFNSLAEKNDNVLNIKDFAKRIVEEIKFQFSKNDLIRKAATGAIEFFKKVGDFIKEDLLANETGNMFFLNIENKNEFKRFYKLYSDSFILRPFLNFTWRNLSSGQKALFNIYSRFYSLTNQIIKGTDHKLKRNVLILIDEGDLYLHPTWQKQFLSIILKFLPAIYSKSNKNESRNIQLVVTSNNPISISDLPNSNVVFLYTDKNLIFVSDSLEDKRLTFAANIHTLYADSFFLKNGLVGDFAKAKINEVIEILQGSKEQILQHQNYLEKIISFIGEPIIKSKLTQMFSERLQLNSADLQNRVTRLEQEVEQLKRNNKG